MEDSYRGADGIPIRFGADQLETDAAIRAALIVAKEAGGAVVCGHQEVEIAIAVKIAESQSAADSRLIQTTTRFRGDIAEFSAAQIEKKLRGLGIAHVTVDVSYGFIDVAIGDRQIKASIQINV